jgi:hypothetical protein
MTDGSLIRCSLRCCGLVARRPGTGIACGDLLLAWRCGPVFAPGPGTEEVPGAGASVEPVVTVTGGSLVAGRR